MSSMTTPRSSTAPFSDGHAGYCHTCCHNSGRAARLVIKHHHDYGRNHRIGEVNGGGYACRHVRVAGQKKKGGSIGQKGQIDEGDGLATRYAERTAF